MDTADYSTRKVKLFGLSFDDISLRKAASLLQKNTGFHIVTTPNVQHVVQINESYELAAIYQESNTTLCDSNIIQILSRLTSRKIEHVVPGSDLTKHFFEQEFLPHTNIMIVGSSEPEVAKLRNKYSLNNLTHYEPPMGFINEELEIRKCVDSIVATKPRYLFLAVGFPRQEILAQRVKPYANFDCAALCVGASIDFLTGKQTRAPIYWQKMKLEWLYRFLQSPRALFYRYFIEGPKVFALAVKEVKQDLNSSSKK